MKWAPAPLFIQIKGIDLNFRAFGAPAATSRQKDLYLCRVALSLGLTPTASGREIVEALAEARRSALIGPKTVADGPCKQNKLIGANVDLTRLSTGCVS
jgi:3-polyprenyl-4-hydroxybenzoate decarboxylase